MFGKCSAGLKKKRKLLKKDTKKPESCLAIAKYVQPSTIKKIVLDKSLALCYIVFNYRESGKPLEEAQMFRMLSSE